MQRFERGGYVFDVRDGGPSDGPVVVLLHGFPQDAQTFAGMMPLLHRAGYRTLAPDLRGVSPGARPSRLSGYRTIESVHDVVAMLDAAGVEKAHILGHGWGGYLAWAVAVCEPQRVQSLTVVSTPHPSAIRAAFGRSLQSMRSLSTVLFQTPFLGEVLVNPRLPVWRGMLADLPAEQAQRYARRMSHRSARSAALNWYRVLRLELPAPSVEWGPVQAPTLFVWGEEDPSVITAAALSTKDFVRGRYVTRMLPAGHWIPEGHPEVLADLVIGHASRAE